MFLSPYLVLFGFLVVGAVLLMVVVGAVILASRPSPLLPAEVVLAQRHVATVAAFGWLLVSGAGLLLVLGLATGVYYGLGSSLGVSITTIAVVPLGLTAVGLGVLLVGELTWPRPQGARRTAVLQDRSASSLLDGRWPRAALGCVVSLVVAVVAFGVVGDPGGRSVSWSDAHRESVASPYPGWAYGVGQLVALAFCVALVALVTVRAARRSAVAAASAEDDLLLRRASVARACRALVCGTLLTLGPDLAVGGSALRRLPPEWMQTLGAVLVLVGLATVLVGLVAPAIPVPRLELVRRPQLPQPSVSA